MAIQIESDLKEILGQINQKLETISNEVKDMNIRLTKVETKLDSELPAIKDSIRETKDSIKELKSTQQAQIWALIGILFTAVAGFLVVSTNWWRSIIHEHFQRSARGWHFVVSQSEALRDRGKDQILPFQLS